MLIPGDDPPFVTLELHEADRDFALRARQGRELIRRLEEGPSRQAELVRRIFAARGGPYPQRFAAERDDERALLEALQLPPELPAGLLAELRDTLRSRVS